MYLRKKIEEIRTQDSKVRLLHCNTDSATIVAPTSELEKIKVDISSKIGAWKNPLSSKHEATGLQNQDTEIVAFLSLGGHVSF